MEEFCSPMAGRDVLQEACIGKEAESVAVLGTSDLKPSAVTLGRLHQENGLTILSFSATVCEMGLALPHLTELSAGLREQMQVKDLA